MGYHEDNPWAGESSNSKNTKDVDNVKWKMGDNTIRICPPIKKGDLPFIKYVIHWIPIFDSQTDKPVVHGTDAYKTCPICKKVNKLWGEVNRLKEEEGLSEDSPEIKRIKKQISKIRGKKTYDMNVIVREDYRDGEGRVKIKRLVAGPTVWKPIIELGNSEKWGNPSSAGDRGYDLTVTVEGEKIKREYTILPDPERKSLTKEELEAIKERAYDLAALRKFSTPEEIIEILESAKPPLDNINLDKAAKELNASAPKAKSKRDEDDEDSRDDEEETPPPSKSGKASRKNDDDDDDDVPPPRSSKKSRDEDDEDEKPSKSSKKPSNDDEDEDETPRSSSKKSRDDDEDEKPKSKKPPVDDDDDDDEDEKPAKSSKKHSNDDDDDEDEKPSRSSKKSSNEDDDDEDEPKSSRKSKDADDDDDSDDSDDDEPKAKKKKSDDDESAFSDKESKSVVTKDLGFSYTEKDIPLDCRGTYDKFDVGCQECKYQANCKALQKEFNAKADELSIDIDGMLGVDVEKAFAKAMGGKSGKASNESEGKGKRKLPF